MTWLALLAVHWTYGPAGPAGPLDFTRFHGCICGESCTPPKATQDAPAASRSKRVLLYLHGPGAPAADRRSTACRPALLYPTPTAGPPLPPNLQLSRDETLRAAAGEPPHPTPTLNPKFSSSPSSTMPHHPCLR
jgi:hypothetical protein